MEQNQKTIPNFSCVLIGRNEEKTLPRLIGSLKEFQDRGGEVICVDTGSTDNTAEVARSLGCKVTEVGDRFRITIDAETAKAINEWSLTDGEESVVEAGQSLFDYSSARNFAATLSSNDMIATPDCDEIWTKLDIDKINSLIDAGVQQFEYNFVFAHDDNGRPLIQFMHSKFYNRTNLKWVGIIHEVLAGYAKREYLDESIAKLEHFQNVETNRSHYLTGLAYDCFMNQNNDRNAHYFARELMYRGRYKSAIKQFERHIAMNAWVTERAQSMIFIGDCNWYLGNREEAIKWYTLAFDLEPNRREPLMKLAELFWRENKPMQAMVYTLGALQIKGVSYYANHQPYYGQIPHEILYWAYWQIGDKEKSKEHFYKALELDPTNPKYLTDKHWYENEEDDLDFTGERMIPGKMMNRQDIEVEHMARYNFASKFTEGRKVLDAACGSGYAKEILKANKYFGVDVSLEAIKYATKHYGEGFSQTDLENETSIKNLDYSLPEIDVVVSFETIEHLEDPKPFLKWVSEHVDTFVFSIPINMPSEFHKQVYSIDEIKSLINNYFPNVSFFGQVNNEIGELDSNSKYVVGVAYKTLPKISIVIPNLGRPDGLRRCLDSIDNLNYPKDLIETIVIEDEPRIGVPKRLKEGVEKSIGEWIIFGSNDIEFTPNCILNAFRTNPDGFVAFNTGIVLEDQGNICEHFMIQKNIVEKLNGEIFDTEFNHVGVDNLLWAKMKKLGIAYREELAIVNHFHWSKTGEELDDVYKLGWDPILVEQDRELLKKKLEELNK